MSEPRRIGTYDAYIIILLLSLTSVGTCIVFEVTLGKVTSFRPEIAYIKMPICFQCKASDAASSRHWQPARLRAELTLARFCMLPLMLGCFVVRLRF